MPRLFSRRPHRAARRSYAEAGFKRAIVNVTPEVHDRLTYLADCACTYRTKAAFALISEVIRRLERYLKYPKPHLEKRTRKLELIFPEPVMKRWRHIGQTHGLLGLGGLACWALSIAMSGPDQEVVQQIQTRPDLRKIATWLRS